VRDPVEAYFTALRDIHASGAGVAEVSYYGALEQLLTEIGSKLKPKVRAFMQLANRGAGNPDGGLFTANQYKRQADAAPLEGQPPARGAIEVKGTGDDVFAIAASEQVARYVERYGLVLVTNLRDFVLVEQGPGGEPRTLESCQLAKNEAAFWGRVAQPRVFAEQASEGLTEFLRRVMLHSAPLADPKDVAWFLASYARTARLRLEHRELPALDQLREQLEESLGLKFEGERGDHFFRSTLVQTLFYGMFASWVLWTREQSTTAAGRDGRFEWETASATLHVPMVSELFYQFSNPGKLRDLHIAEVLEWAEEVLNRVNRAEFFRRFAEDHAVQYFYEPFLEAFDPELRKDLGVWYTPDEVVKHMVARVDWALREELGIADGLADPSVYVLDPCCGTGAYLVEVLRKIDETLNAKGADALTRHDVKRAAMERVIGFEIMPAPFVIAHLQLGLLLADLGVPLSSSSSEDERAAVYLTNALTGWSNDVAPPKDRRVHADQMHSTLLLSEFAEEKDAANHVKREAPILVVLGNPPYNSYAGMAIGEERELTEAYRTTKRAPKPQGQGLNDLYVRFFRMAERQIVEKTGKGIVCLISNYSWLDGLSFTGMRERFLDVFDSIWIDNLNGDKYKTGKLTPEGKPDPSIFSTEKNREGIQVGTAITMLVRDGQRPERGVHYREWWGTQKRAELAAAAEGSGSEYEHHEPELALGLTFRPSQVAEGYLSWPKIPDLFPVSFPGVKTSRDDFVVDIDRDRLEERIRTYLDPAVSDAEILRRWPSAMQSTAGFDATATRRSLQPKGFVPTQLIPFAYRPFDTRWLYWEPETKLLDRERTEYVTRVLSSEQAIVSQQKPRRRWSVPQVITEIGCLDLMDRGATIFPMVLHESVDWGLLESSTADNLSTQAQDYCAHSGTAVHELAAHSLAIIHAPRYAAESAGALTQDWPRVPLPSSSDTLLQSVSLGARVVALFDGTHKGLRLQFGVLSTIGNSPLDPVSGLAVNARWGIAGKGGITMPSTGKLAERDYTDDECAAIAETAESLGMVAEQAIGLLGETCCDVYLNDVAYWRCVPRTCGATPSAGTR